MQASPVPTELRQSFVIPTAVLLLGAAFWFLFKDDTRMGWLFLVALAMGISLYHASFGFAGAYRRLFRQGDPRGVDGQIILLVATMLVFAPVLSSGSAFGNPVGGAIAPVGLGMVFGAFLFGIGMQFGGACASGTLYTAGGGNPRMMVVLIFFIVGAFWGSLDLGWWQTLPRMGAVSLGKKFGWEVTYGVQLGILVALYMALGRLRRRFADQVDDGHFTPFHIRLIRGPWPLIWAGLSLAVLNWLTLVQTGHPWSITWGFSLWGAKAATLVGWDPQTSRFWMGAFQQRALSQSLWQDTTTVMNVGIIGGATLAMFLANRRAGLLDKRWRPMLAAVLGGLMLGYGARLAYGCNIGAFISGVASTSLHGWVWILCALPGNWLGMKFRSAFQLD